MSPYYNDYKYESIQEFDLEFLNTPQPQESFLVRF